MVASSHGALPAAQATTPSITAAVNTLSCTYKWVCLYIYMCLKYQLCHTAEAGKLFLAGKQIPDQCWYEVPCQCWYEVPGQCWYEMPSHLCRNQAQKPDYQENPNKASARGFTSTRKQCRKSKLFTKRKTNVRELINRVYWCSFIHQFH